MPALQATPRRPLSRMARFRLAYNVYGWKIMVVVVLVIGCVFIVGGMYLARNIPIIGETVVGDAIENDSSIFQTEMLYSAAHHYSNDHKGRLPTSSTWQSALRPYFTHAGATLVIKPMPAMGNHYVMNRALSGGTLALAPDPSHTLLFWQAMTDSPDLPPTSYRNATGPFLGITCDGTPIYAVPTGKANDLPLLRRAQYYRPHK